MSRLLTVVFLLLLCNSPLVFASSCVAFDVNWNLLAFNLNGKDFNASTQNTWQGSTPAADITTQGRPPFDGAKITCYLSQYYNAIYVMGADTNNTSSVYIYDATAQSWSTQTVTAGNFTPSSFDAILDHDTNTFYALSDGNELFYLDMSELTAASSTPLSWMLAEDSPFPSTYQPVMALAQNHIYFLDAPSVSAGSAVIFVIHYSWFQPTPQPYPLSNGSAFPATYGQAASFFQSDNTVQQEFAFITQDSSAVYVINVESNTTQILAGPTNKDPKATYFASVTALVQLDSEGAVSFLSYQEDNANANGAATWSPVNVLSAAAPPASSMSSSSSSSSTGTHSGTSSAPSSSGTTSRSSSSTNYAISSRVVSGMTSVVFVLGALVCLL